MSDLATDSASNNVDLFDAKKMLPDVALPSTSGVGMAVNGQSIFPVWNNRGLYTPSLCEVDSCQEHVGQGGGQPHFHGDPFGDEDSTSGAPTRCLYGPSNYTSVDGVGGDTAAHPPVIGFAFDGHLIYGR